MGSQEQAAVAPPMKILEESAPRSEFRDHWQTVVGAMIGGGFGVRGLMFFSLGLFVLPLSTTFGWSRAQVSAGTAFMEAGLILTTPLIGSFTDRLGPRRVGLFAMAGFGLALCALSQINHNIGFFYGLMFLLAMLGSGGSPVTWTRAIAGSFDRHRGIALGLGLSGTGLVAVFAPRIISQVIADHGWRWAYFGMGAVTLLIAMPLVAYFMRDFKLPERKDDAKSLESGVTLREAIRMPWFWFNALFFALVTGGLAAPITHFAAMLQDKGHSLAEAAAIQGLIGFAIMGGRLLLGAMVDRFPASYVGTVFLLFASVGSLALIGDYNAIGIMMIGFATGAEVDLLAYVVSRKFGIRNYGKIYAWQITATMVSVGVSPVLMGMAHGRWGSYDTGLIVNAAVLAIGAIGIGLLSRSLGKPALAI